MIVHANYAGVYGPVFVAISSSIPNLVDCCSTTKDQQSEDMKADHLTISYQGKQI